MKREEKDCPKCKRQAKFDGGGPRDGHTSSLLL